MLKTIWFWTKRFLEVFLGFSWKPGSHNDKPDYHKFLQILYCCFRVDWINMDNNRERTEKILRIYYCKISSELKICSGEQKIQLRAHERMYIYISQLSWIKKYFKNSLTIQIIHSVITRTLFCPQKYFSDISLFHL